VRDVECLGHPAGVVDVLPGAACALAMRRLAVIVELERDADHVVAGALDQAGRHRGIHPARHRHDDAGSLRRPREIKLHTDTVRPVS